MFAALLSLCALLNSTEATPEMDLPSREYLVFQLTNIAGGVAVDRVAELQATFGPVSAGDKRMPAFGWLPPLLLKDSVEQLQRKINDGFDLAEKNGIPVYFQLDDVNFVSREIAADPEMVEWLGFPAEGQPHGPIARYWFNWGAWVVQPGFPAIGSPKLREYVVDKLRRGVLEPMVRRIDQLRATGRAHLFAGVAIGWETHIPNYTPGEPIFHLDPAAPPVAAQGEPGEAMAPHEMRQLGAASLHWRGYDRKRLESEAADLGIAPEEHMRQCLYEVIHEYSALMARTAHEAGLPRTHVFTHMVPLDSLSPPVTATVCPPIEAAVNPHSTPGWTLSNTTAPFDLETIKQRIASARGTSPAEVSFICAETYFLGVNKRQDFAAFLEQMFGGGATRMVVWGITDPPTTPYAGYPRHGAIRAILEWLGRCP